MIRYFAPSIFRNREARVGLSDRCFIQHRASTYIRIHLEQIFPNVHTTFDEHFGNTKFLLCHTSKCSKKERRGRRKQKDKKRKKDEIRRNAKKKPEREIRKRALLVKALLQVLYISASMRWRSFLSEQPVMLVRHDKKIQERIL